MEEQRMGRELRQMTKDRWGCCSWEGLLCVRVEYIIEIASVDNLESEAGSGRLDWFDKSSR